VIPDKTNVAWTATNLLPATNPIRDGFIFSGWYTEANGAGDVVTGSTAYSDLANDTETPSVIIYANWIPAGNGSEGWMIGNSFGEQAAINVTLKRSMVVQFTALFDGVVMPGPHNWYIAETQFATVNSSGVVTVNKLYVGQIKLELRDQVGNLLTSIAIRIIS
jgi:uncharacterized repeat protein (TIGR02543 family)